MKKSSVILLIALIIMLLGSVLGYLVQSDFTEVQVQEVRIQGQEGNQISGLLYVPENAGPETPAPAVMTMHGFINSRETQSGFNIEFARRGYVVLALDMTGHGYSEQYHRWPLMLEDPAFSFGASDGLRYLAGLPFVDEAKIGVEGHSMGGWAMISAALQNPGMVHTLILAGSGPLAEGMVTENSRFNLAVIFGEYDEFSELMWGKDRAVDLVEAPNLKNAFGVTEPVEPFKLYGSFEDRTARMLYTPEETHPRNHHSSESIGYAVDFMQQSIPAPEPLETGNQAWQWKELGTLLVLVGLILFVFALGSRLLETPYFGVLKQNLPAPYSLRKVGWWIGALIATLIPVAAFIQITVPYAGNQLNAFWPQLITNGLVRFVLVISVAAVVLFLLWHFLSARRKGGNVVSYGLSTDSQQPAFDIMYIGRALLLAAVVAGAAHILLSLLQCAFTVDARFWVFAFKPMDASRLVIFLAYLLPFFIFFLVNGLILHGQLRPEDDKDTPGTTAKWMVAAFGINALGLVVMLAAHLAYLFATGGVFIHDLSLFMILCYQIVFVLAVASAVSAYFFKKTGNIFTGVFLNTFLVTWYIIAGQAILWPV